MYFSINTIFIYVIKEKPPFSRGNIWRSELKYRYSTINYNKTLLKILTVTINTIWSNWVYAFEFIIYHIIFVLINYSEEVNLYELMKKYLCLICGLIYDESKGWPEDDIEPGTKWEDVPDTWMCPDCGATKMDFDMIEIT